MRIVIVLDKNLATAARSVGAAMALAAAGMTGLGDSARSAADAARELRDLKIQCEKQRKQMESLIHEPDYDPEPRVITPTKVTNRRGFAWHKQFCFDRARPRVHRWRNA